LAPSDFSLFEKPKMALMGVTLDTEQELLDNAIPREELESVLTSDFEDWTYAWSTAGSMQNEARQINTFSLS
jgi:hypothetical protein